MSENVRIDKFLWAVRLYKTRTLASEACRLGKVKCGNTSLKPSHQVQSDEVYVINIEHFNKTIKVKQLISNRISASLVSDFIEDLTSDNDYKLQEQIRRFAFEKREKGTGRPTKRDRRNIKKAKDLDL